MLGKGLESLIPSAGSGDDSGAQGGILPAPQERDTSAEVRPEETPASAERTDSGDAAILGSPPRGVQEADPPLVVTPPPPSASSAFCSPLSLRKSNVRCRPAPRWTTSSFRASGGSWPRKCSASSEYPRSSRKLTSPTSALKWR